MYAAHSCGMEEAGEHCEEECESRHPRPLVGLRRKPDEVTALNVAFIHRLHGWRRWLFQKFGKKLCGSCDWAGYS